MRLQQKQRRLLEKKIIYINRKPVGVVTEEDLPFYK